MKYTASELFNFLNELDEANWIEAKLGSDIGKSLMETVCAFSNEPGLGGGYIIMGVSSIEESLFFSEYRIEGVKNPDKLQQEIATQCAITFNIPIRPDIVVENFQGFPVICIFVPEVPISQKPVYIKSKGLPTGAYRRIGSTDIRGTEEDLSVFYQNQSDSYDRTPVKKSSMELVDSNAIKLYRQLRANVNPAASELTYNDFELLQALGCINLENSNELNLAGLMTFGTNAAQRMYFPALRIDYIRVPGNDWVPSPDNRFSTLEFRGSLISTLYKVVDAINTDLPKGFLLPENSLQARATGLPLRALREAIVNALIHRSYRINRPTQVIRYDNRIEIVNPGFSLKSEDRLGFAGSTTRNPFIAEIFHETNLSENKGTGIRAMRDLMLQAHLAPPTFESDREEDEFTVRLLLHHFLDQKDLIWLQKFAPFNLNDFQQQALIFIREVGAIDNQTYRQMADCDMTKASLDLRNLKKLGLLEIKGKGKKSYYVAGNNLLVAINTEGKDINTEGKYLTTEANDLEVVDIETIDARDADLSTEAKQYNRGELLDELPYTLKSQILEMKQRERDAERINKMILFICDKRPYKLAELACIFQKGDNYLSRQYISPLLKSNKLEYLHPDMKSHPQQAYMSKKANSLH